MTYVCGSTTTVPGEVLRILVGMTGCCAGATESPADCTCWQPVYDHDDQAPPDPDTPIAARPTACADCAYRPGSPERAGDERHTCSEPGELDRVARTSVFWCHDGMRKVIAWRHATLPIEVQADGDFYKPPIAARAGLAVPYRADGTAGVLCAGWAAAARVADGKYAWLAEEATAEALR